MKSFGVFVLGFILGGAVIGFVIVGPLENDGASTGGYYVEGLTMLDQPGECITKNNLTIFQTMEPNIALAEYTNEFIGPMVLLIDYDGRTFYDGMEIKVPNGQCARQIGTFQYETKMGIMSTLPAVMIDSYK